MGADREKFCDYCKHYMQDYDLCSLSGRKPAFEQECSEYDEKEGVVKKDLNRKESSVERIIFAILKGACVLAFAVLCIWAKWNIKVIGGKIIKGESLFPTEEESTSPIDHTVGNIDWEKVSFGNTQTVKHSPPAGDVPKSVQEKMDSARAAYREFQQNQGK